MHKLPDMKDRIFILSYFQVVLNYFHVWNIFDNYCKEDPKWSHLGHEGLQIMWHSAP